MPIAHCKLTTWARMDSNHRTPKRTDLQSVAVGHLATYPSFVTGADGGIRTPDPLITNQLLWPAELHRHKTHLFTRTYIEKTTVLPNFGVQIYYLILIFGNCEQKCAGVYDNLKLRYFLTNLYKKMRTISPHFYFLYSLNLFFVFCFNSFNLAL